MPIAGSVDTAQVDLEVYGPDTEATLLVTTDVPGVDPQTVDGTPVDYGDPSLDNKSWRARVEYPEAGLYTHKWTITGTGEGVKTLKVGVGPADVQDPRPSYANTGDLVKYTHAAPPLDAEKLLRDATEDVDDAVLSWFYETDDEEFPADERLLAIFVEATCEQARWRSVTAADEADQMAGYTNVSIAGVSLSRQQGRNGAPAGASRYSPKLGTILAKAADLVVARGPWN